MEQMRASRPTRADSALSIFAVLTLAGVVGVILSAVFNWPGWAVAVLAAGLVEAAMGMIMAYILRGLINEQRRTDNALVQH